MTDGISRGYWTKPLIKRTPPPQPAVPGIIFECPDALETNARDIWKSAQEKAKAIDAVMKARDDLPTQADPVDHPKHYTDHPSGIECITITEFMGFNLGNALKYIWRCDLKKDAIEDLKKAAWYIQREITKREKRTND